MIGNMIALIRKQKNVTKTKLSELTGINIGHLTHIEKGERNPSHRALYSICKALDIPYEELYYTYDKELTEEHKKYKYINYISYDQVPLFSNLDGFINCPSKFSNASFAVKAQDDSMAPSILKDAIVYVEVAGLLSNKDIGLFKTDDQFIIRRFLYRKNEIVLRAEDKSVEDVKVSVLKDFKIIGKIYV